MHVAGNVGRLVLIACLGAQGRARTGGVEVSLQYLLWLGLSSCVANNACRSNERLVER